MSRFKPRSFVLPPAAALACAVFAAACVSDYNPGPRDPSSGLFTRTDSTRGVTCYSPWETWARFACVKTKPETVFVREVTSGKSQLRPGAEVDSLRLALR